MANEIKRGSTVEVRNAGTDEQDAAVWAKARVVRANPDGTFVVRVDHEGHELHGEGHNGELIVDAEHIREA